MFCLVVEHKIKVLKQQYNFIRDTAKDTSCGKTFIIPLQNAYTCYAGISGLHILMTIFRN